MKKIDVGQAISLLANIGVIAGIVFLGLELRQNNLLLNAQTRGDTLRAVIDNEAEPYRNHDVATLLAKKVTLGSWPFASFTQPRPETNIMGVSTCRRFFDLSKEFTPTTFGRPGSCYQWG